MSQQDQPQVPPPASRGEKDEREEKGRHEEKSWDEKWQRDPLSVIAWAIVLIWAGLVLLADNLGVFFRVAFLTPWGLIFLGAGVIVLLVAAVRLAVPAYRRPVGGAVILGIIFIAIGLGNLISWNLVLPLVLIVIGIAILLGGFLRGR